MAMAPMATIHQGPEFDCHAVLEVLHLAEDLGLQILAVALEVDAEFLDIALGLGPNLLDLGVEVFDVTREPGMDLLDLGVKGLDIALELGFTCARSRWSTPSTSLRSRLVARLPIIRGRTP